MIKVTYLDHSGFLVELEDAYFLFDYYNKIHLPQEVIFLDQELHIFLHNICLLLIYKIPFE